jgi:hypothetical protein
MMHRDLVERRRWISEHRLLHALNYTMVLPGPEAQQLATSGPSRRPPSWPSSRCRSTSPPSCWRPPSLALSVAA